jgi:hypothetical protein
VTIIFGIFAAGFAARITHGIASGTNTGLLHFQPRAALPPALVVVYDRIALGT